MGDHPGRRDLPGAQVIRRGPRPALLVTAALAWLAVPGLLVALPGQAAGATDAWASYTAVAESDGIHVGAVVPGAPLNDRLLDGGAPRAQAVLTGLGASTAYAAAPWPGELIANAPGLLSAIIGLPVPPYPLLVTSSHPVQPERHQAAGPVELEATSGPARSDSSAVAAAGAGRSQTTSEVVRDSAGTLTAAARSVVEGLVVGPLTLGRVEARATVVRRPGAAAVRTTKLIVAGARIADTAVELTPDGLALAGTTVPLSAADPLRAALAGQGITVSWTDGNRTPDGVVSSALVVTVTRPFALAGQGDSSVSLTLGRAVARVSGSPLGIDAGAAVDQAPSPAAAGPSGIPGGGASAGLRPPAQPRQPVAAPGPPTTAAAEESAFGTAALRPVRQVELWPSLYLPLAIAGLVAAGALRGLQSFGVRRVWA